MLGRCLYQRTYSRRLGLLPLRIPKRRWRQRPPRSGRMAGHSESVAGTAIRAPAAVLGRALSGDIGSVSAGAILRPLLAAAETGHYDDMSKGVDFLTCAELRTTGNAQPGNEVPFSSGNIILGAAIGGAQLLLLIGTVWRLRTLLWFGLLGDTVWLLLHIMSLWMPYIRAAPRRNTRGCMRVSSAALPSCCQTLGITSRPTRCTSSSMCL